LGQILLLGYRLDWHAGGGYGPRYFIDLLPFLAVGFICLLPAMRGRASLALLAVCALGLIVHQAVLVYAVEHGTDGWVDLPSYLAGQPIGYAWQFKSLRRLLEDPRLWLAPRPYIAQARQTISENLMAGTKDPGAYLITGTAALLAPFAVALFYGVRHYANRSHVPLILSAVAAYMGAWSVYLMLVG
jgi:hypothetical protein